MKKIMSETQRAHLIVPKAHRMELGFTSRLMAYNAILRLKPVFRNIVQPNLRWRGFLTSPHDSV